MDERALLERCVTRLPICMKETILNSSQIKLVGHDCSLIADNYSK